MDLNKNESGRGRRADSRRDRPVRDDVDFLLCADDKSDGISEQGEKIEIFGTAGGKLGSEAWPEFLGAKVSGWLGDMCPSPTRTSALS